LSNKQIADILLNQEKKALVVADSAEPKSIDEIMSYGVSIIPAVKGQGSVNQGIQAVQSQRISYTKRSVDLDMEYRAYLWETDRQGKIINEPSPIKDHLMSGIRYAIATLVAKQETEYKSYDPEIWRLD
jgi:phage terminase large subunit